MEEREDLIPMEQLREIAKTEQCELQSVDEKPTLPSLDLTEVGGAIDNVKKTIVGKVATKINDKKIVEKHSGTLAKTVDQALQVEAEKERLKVEQANADNKIKKQEIKNKLIVLKNEAILIEREQKQLLKEQKERHKKANADAKWLRYEKKLTKMGYGYVPNWFVLSMLLFFDGIKSFFDGISSVSTAIVKAFKWVLISALVITILMSIPISREWLLKILKFR